MVVTAALVLVTPAAARPLVRFGGGRGTTGRSSQTSRVHRAVRARESGVDGRGARAAQPGAARPERGTRFSAWSSENLAGWTDEGVVLAFGPGVSWGDRDARTPA
ncbi:hypothetical protein [Lentzea sp. NPDC060358]|uniref:hypothetical protein n=1 Tax=Lentzea sp. NPDC060358 TaxID=3347103 RepID=UPI00364FC643